MSSDNLVTRFEKFIDTFEGAERIDEMAVAHGLTRSKRADFFFANRTIVCEIKSLETSTNMKKRTILEQAGIDIPPDGAWLNDLIAGRPDSDQLYDKIMTAGTTALAEGLQEANKQITATMKAFGLESADGLVIILHGRVRDINPNVMVQRIAQRFAKNSTASQPYHDHIAMACIFSEMHKLEIEPDVTGDVVIPVPNPRVPERHGVGAFLADLHERWAAFNGLKVLTIKQSQLPPARW